MSKSIHERAIEWLLGDDTGMSSKSLCAFMLGNTMRFGYPPSDSFDRGRCIRLLDLIPEWWSRLDELDNLPAKSSLVFSHDGARENNNSWHIQIPKIREEGNHE
jgi:hypothetical protein